MEYTERNGFFFSSKTPEGVMAAIATAYHRQTRIRFWYGHENGKSWSEENEVIGTVGRSMGPIKVPLLIHSRRSYGGGEILTNRIVKIVDTHSRRVLYQHPTFDVGVFAEVAPVDADKGYVSAASENGELVAQFKTADGARKWIAFMKGERFCK